MHSETHEELAGLALYSARRFLQRWSDRFTINAREDLAQEAALAAWLHADRVRDRSRFPAMVRTIARRRRYRAIQQCMRLARRTRSWDDAALIDPRRAAGEPLVRLRGVSVPWPWLVAQLDDVLQCVTALNRSLLLGYYEGFSCSELAQRFDLSEDCVKVRIHRSRLRLRKEFEARVEHTDPASWCDGSRPTHR